MNKVGSMGTFCRDIKVQIIETNYPKLRFVFRAFA